MTNVFLDMDGVLVDLNQGLINLYGETYHDLDKSDLWLNQMSKHKNFFKYLNPTPYSKNLFNFIKGLKTVNIEILTAIPYLGYPDVIDDKKYWIKRHICNSVIVNTVISGILKSDYVSSNNDILIDDTLENILAWQERGGIGIHHNQYQPERTFLELSIILNNL